jgi:hypothetical protein
MLLQTPQSRNYQKESLGKAQSKDFFHIAAISQFDINKRHRKGISIA